MDLAAPRDRIGASRRGVQQPQRVTGDRGVARLEAASGVSFQHIAAARAETERRLVERRSRMASVQVDEDAAVVLMGSWGRREVTSKSDDDFMVLLVAAPRETLCRRLRKSQTLSADGRLVQRRSSAVRSDSTSCAGRSAATRTPMRT